LQPPPMGKSQRFASFPHTKETFYSPNVRSSRNFPYSWQVSRIFHAQHQGEHNTGWVQNNATSGTWQSCPVDVSASCPSRTGREQSWIIQFMAWSTTLVQAWHLQNLSCTNCSLPCTSQSVATAWSDGATLDTPWHTIPGCISVTSLSVESLPSYPRIRMKGRASALHHLVLHPCLMSCLLGCNYEKSHWSATGKCLVLCLNTLSCI